MPLSNPPDPLIVRYTDTSQSPALGVHQGYTTDGTKHYTFDTTLIQRRTNDGSWTVEAENTDPLNGLSTVTHLGDGCYYNGKLYTPINFYGGIGSTSDQKIGVYNATTLARTDAFDISSTTLDYPCGFCIGPSPIDGTDVLFGADYVDGSQLWYFNITTGAFIGTLTLSATLDYLQGISYTSGGGLPKGFYLSSNWGHLFHADTDGTVRGVVATGNPDDGTFDSHEGIDVTQGEIRWLIDKGSSDRKVHYYTTRTTYRAQHAAQGEQVYVSGGPSNQLVLGKGPAEGIQLGPDASTAGRIWGSAGSSKVIRLMQLLNLIGDRSAAGSAFTFQVLDSNGNITSQPVFSIDYDPTVGIRMGPKGGASVRDMALKRDSAGARWKTSEAFVADDGLTTKVADTSGLTSTQIDALFTVTPPNGTVISDDTNGVLWVRQGGLWYPRALLHAEAVTTGEETIARDHISAAGITIATGAVRLSYFTAKKSETVTQAIVPAGANISGTATLIKYALFTVASNGDLTQVAVTANDTALLAVSGTEYAKAFAASYDKVAGKRYAFGVVQVGATSVTLIGNSVTPGAVTARAPRIAAQLTGQSDMPSSISSGSLALSSGRIYGIVAP